MLSLRTSEVVLQVKDLLQDANDYDVESAGLNSSGQFDLQMIIDGINFAVRQYCQMTNATVTSATQQVPATGILSVPTSQMDIKDVAVDGQLLVSSSWSLENLLNSAWRTATGPVEKWVLEDFRNIRLTPITANWGTATIYANIYYQEAPGLLTAIGDVSPSTCIVGNWYRISSVGSTNWVSMGAGSSTVGVEFRCTCVGSGTGVCHEIVDARVTYSDQYHLKYGAAFHLCNLMGTSEGMQKAKVYMDAFKSLVGA